MSKDLMSMALDAITTMSHGDPLEFRLKIDSDEKWSDFEGIRTLISLLHDDRYEVRPKHKNPSYFICRECMLSSHCDDAAMGGYHM